MRDDRKSLTRDGDVSPINKSISNLADDGKKTEEPKASSSKSRKAELLHEILPNFSRVTPAQLSCISFSSESRYQPVRAVSTKPPKGAKSTVALKSPISSVGAPSENYAGGGGIIILRDLKPEEEAEFIELTPPPQPPAPAPAIQIGTVAAPTLRLNITLDPSTPEANPPESFQV